MKPRRKYITTCLLIVFIVTNAFGQDTLTTIPFEMSNCVQLYLKEGKKVVTSRTLLDSLIRNDGSEERCFKILKETNFSRYSLLGIDLNTGWCRVPGGLNYTTTRLDDEKKYVFTISYDDPNEPCRALSTYDLWVKVPVLPKGYIVDFVINPKRIREH